MSIVLSRFALLPYIHIYLWPSQFVFGLCLYFSNMKSIVVVIQQPSAELRHFLFSLKLFALLVRFWQSGLSNINCSLQEVMVNCMFQSCEMISLVLLLYVSVHSNCIVLCWNVIKCFIFIIRNEPSFEMTFNHGGQTHIYGADDWDTIYSWMSTIHKVCSRSV